MALGLRTKSMTADLTVTFGYFSAHSVVAALSLSALRPMKSTFWPLRANSKAIALPMPSVAPVTTAHSPYAFLRFFPGRISVLYSRVRKSRACFKITSAPMAAKKAKVICCAVIGGAIACTHPEPRHLPNNVHVHQCL